LRIACPESARLRVIARDASKNGMQRARAGRLFGVFAVVAISGWASVAPATVEWQAPERIPAPEELSAWFASPAVDSHGRVHVVWSDTAHRRSRATRTPSEQLMYAVRESVGWSAPRPIAIAQYNIYRQSLTVDAHDRLHLLFRYTPGGGLDLYYRQAQAEQGFTEGQWQRPRLVNFRWNTYAGDIAAHGDVLHMLFDDVGTSSKECPVCADIYYQRSRDGGDTWSPPGSLRPSPRGAAGAHIFVDSAGVLHVTWDEGWDRNSGNGRPESGIYMLSPNDGETWTAPTVVTWPHNTNAQLTAGSDGTGSVLLVWRTTEGAFPYTYYQWSNDWGATWSEPAAIPGIRARPRTNNFDRFHLATDGTGTMHLLAGGMVKTGDAWRRPSLYHLEWDGQRWSQPTVVYDGAGFPEYPQLVIDADGGIHATWYVRAAEFGEEPPHQVWYAHGRLADAGLPSARPASVMARALAPAPTPMPLPDQQRATEPAPLIRDPQHLLVLAVSIPIGALITLVTDWLVRRRRPAV
jgi:hypothetical protein